jgi:hypothetical protein
MTSPESQERLWPRPVGLAAIAVALAVGHPLLLILIPFGLLAFLVPGGRLRSLMLGALALGIAFAGLPGSGLWYLERGWAILVGGWFTALTLAWPARPFLPRALGSLAGATVWSAAVLLALDGWGRVEWAVSERIRASATATLEMARLLGRGGEPGALAEAVSRTAGVQETLFPALLALSTLGGLGAAWWIFVRAAGGSGAALGPLRNFRFPDPMIWLLIGGVALGLLTGWTEGWGRLGSNLTMFMAALYALRGGAVLLFLSGGVSWVGGLFVTLAFVLAAPLVLAGATVVGVGDSWFDLRARAFRGAGGGPR